MPVRRVLATVLVIVLLPATAAAAARTRVVRVSPLTASGQVRPGLRVAAGGSGTCQPFSEAVPGAFRCFSDSNFVLDPCWRARTHTVLCLPTPWARTATRMHVRGRLGRPSRAFGGLPWGVRLRDGERCLALQGATNVVRGRRVSYGCGHGRFLAGKPDRHHRFWRIRRTHLVHGRFVLGGTAVIRTAYFGRA